MLNGSYSYNPQLSIERINNQIAELEKLKSQIPQTPIMQNFQFNQPTAMRFVDNIDVVNKEVIYADTPFFSKDMSVLWVKKVNGEVKVYELNELIEKDEKDIKIEMLEMKIKKLEEVNNEQSNNNNDVKSVENKKSTTSTTDNEYDK